MERRASSRRSPTPATTIMGLHIVIGYPTKNRAAPVMVYCGPTASAADAARAADTRSQWWEIIQNPVPRAKNNPRYVKPATAALPAAPPIESPPPDPDPPAPAATARRRS